MKINKTKKSRRIKIAATIAVVLLALVAISAVFAYSTNSWPFGNQSESSDTSGSVNEINYEPPTEQDKSSSQDAKRQIIDDADLDTNNPEPEDSEPAGGPVKKSVAVNISYADIFEDKLEVRAFTSNVIQGAGTCTVTASKPGSQAITRTSPAFVDASSTICEPIYIPVSQLSPGAWDVNVNFSSSTHQGSSGSIKVEV